MYSRSPRMAALKVVPLRTRARKRAVQARLRYFVPLGRPLRRSSVGSPLRPSQGETKTVSSATLPRSTRRRWALIPIRVGLSWVMGGVGVGGVGIGTGQEAGGEPVRRKIEPP